MKAICFVACSLVFLVFADGAAAQARTTPICDSSPRAVQRDEASLRDAIKESLSFLFGDTDRDRLDRLAASIQTEYVGPAQLVPAPADAIARPSRATPPDTAPANIAGWVGVNPASCNQFRIRVNEETGRQIGARATQKGFGRADPGRGGLTARVRDWNLQIVDQLGPPQTGPYFSGCQDTRMRSGTLTYPQRTIASFSGQQASCTGTLVGPRHVITAGHCLYLGNNTWYDFTVIPGRDGSLWPFGSTQMSDTEGLNQGFRWYWIPDPAFTQYPDWFSGLDIGIIVLPQRLGDVTGWMGVVARSDATLSAQWHTNYGYPGGGGGPIGFHSFQIEGGLYGDINACDVGDYSHPDAQGWGRVAGHSCDNSGGHSGGPIYHWWWDPAVQAVTPNVSLIISHHAAFSNDFDCANNPRPYSATRITPEYLDAFMFFRSWKP